MTRDGPSRRVTWGAGLEVAAAIAFVAGFPAPVFLFVAWPLGLAGFAVLATQRDLRVGAVTGASVLVLLVVLVLSLMGVTAKGIGGAAASTAALGPAFGSVAAIFSLPAAWAVFVAWTATGRTRALAAAALAVAAAGAASLAAGAPEGVLAASFLVGAVAGAAAFVPFARTALARRVASAP